VSGIGEQLREARETRGLSLEDAERATRIRAKQLAAMEAGDFSDFASLAQARGFLRSYAAFLGLDVETLIAGLQNNPRKRSPFAPAASAPKGESRPGRAGRLAPLGPTPTTGMPPVRDSWWRRVFTRDLLIGGVVVGLFGLLLTWGAWQLWQGGFTPAVTATSRPPLSVLGLTPATTLTTPTPTTPAVTPTAPLPTPLPNYVGVNIVVRAEQRLWLRAAVDGVETFVGQMAPGQTREFAGNTVVELWTGNARGTRVVFNGQDQGTLGDRGEVVIRLWTANGAVTPTPSSQP
jgi:transcriptional regulator with XRE-family HTH domain